MTQAKRHEITVEAVAQYLEDESDPEQQRYVFAYHITLTNVGTVAAKLISRHWIITDADGDAQEVRGLGVVGEQPELGPGERFEYTSGCALTTSVGTMQGSYRMRADDGHEFEAEIPAFMLAVPKALH